MTSAGVSEMPIYGRVRRSSLAHFHSGILDCGEKESTVQLVISRVHLRGKMEERYTERCWLHRALKPCMCKTHIHVMNIERICRNDKYKFRMVVASLGKGRCHEKGYSRGFKYINNVYS